VSADPIDFFDRLGRYMADNPTHPIWSPEYGSATAGGIDPERPRPRDPGDFFERLVRYLTNHPAHPFWLPEYHPQPLDPSRDPYGYLPFNPLEMTSDASFVDMRTFRKPHARTSLGYARDKAKYWTAVLEADLRRDESERILSDRNRSLIAHGDTPEVDWLWVRHHRAAQPYLGDKLVHHHWDQGPIAFAIPESVHTKFDALLHWVTSTREGPK